MQIQEYIANHTNNVARIGLITLLVLFLCFGILFASYTKTLNAPDEQGHYYNIRLIGDKGQLPRLTSYPITKEGHQPPAYYLLVQPVYLLTTSWSEHNQVLALRIFSLLLGAITVLITFLTIKKLFPDSTFLILGATALVALNPQFIFISGIVNNDCLASALGAVCLYILVLVLTRLSISAKLIFTGSLVAAAAFLSKTTLWPLVAALFILFLVKVKKEQRLLTLGLFAPLYGVGIWWLCRNYLVYHSLTGFLYMKELWYADQHKNFLSFSGVKNWLNTIFSSFWARFGYFNIVIPKIYYQLLKLLAGVSIVSLVYFFTKPFQHIEKQKKFALMVLLCMAIVIFAGIFIYSLSFYQAQGRYLFPVISALMIFLAIGLFQLVPIKVHWALFTALILFLLIVDWQSMLVIKKYG
jgi:hypothetical protein